MADDRKEKEEDLHCPGSGCSAVFQDKDGLRKHWIQCHEREFSRTKSEPDDEEERPTKHSWGKSKISPRKPPGKYQRSKSQGQFGKGQIKQPSAGGNTVPSYCCPASNCEDPHNFGSEIKLQRHWALKHEPFVRHFGCPFWLEAGCRYHTNNNTNLQRHARIHSYNTVVCPRGLEDVDRALRRPMLVVELPNLNYVDPGKVERHVDVTDYYRVARKEPVSFRLDSQGIASPPAKVTSATTSEASSSAKPAATSRMSDRDDPTTPTKDPENKGQEAVSWFGMNPDDVNQAKVWMMMAKIAGKAKRIKLEQAIAEQDRQITELQARCSQLEEEGKAEREALLGKE